MHGIFCDTKQQTKHTAEVMIIPMAGTSTSVLQQLQDEDRKYRRDPVPTYRLLPGVMLRAALAV